MDIQHLVDRLEDLIDEGRHVPFSKFTLIDEERALEIIDQMRISVPEQIEKASRLIKLDMTGARDHWLKQAEKNPEEHKRREESDFLKDITDEGLIDFHSLRHTFGTMLAKSGAHPKTAQALMRHSTIALTMDRYTHSIREAETAAIADLPAFPAIMETMLATGTDTGNISAANYVDYLAGESGLLTNNADYSGLKQGGAKSAKTSLFTGKTGLLAQKCNCACRDSNPEPSVPKTDALSN